MLLTLRTEEGITSQGMWAPLEPEQGNILPQNLQKEHSPAHTLSVVQ